MAGRIRAVLFAGGLGPAEWFYFVGSSSCPLKPPEAPKYTSTAQKLWLSLKGSFDDYFDGPSQNKQINKELINKQVEPPRSSDARISELSTSLPGKDMTHFRRDRF